MADFTPYEILGLGEDATAAEVKSAYLKAAKTVHPDAGGTPGMFGVIREAYEVLSDPRRREEYDAGSRAPTPPPSTVEPDWGEETPDEDLLDDHDTVVSAPARRPRSWFWSSLGYFAVKVAMLAAAAALSWFLVQPALGRSYRPAGSGDDLFGGVEEMGLLGLALLAYGVCLVASLVGFYYWGLAVLTLAAVGGLIAWPFAYWDLATGAERWLFLGWCAAFLAYQALLVALLLGRWDDAAAERAADE